MAAVLPLYAQPTIAGNNVKVALPDAPQPAIAIPATSQASQDQSSQQTVAATRYAPRLAKYIEPDQLTRRLSPREKLELSVHEQIRPYSLSTQLLAAGWEHLINGHPKYGTDSAGFGERLGAASIRQNSAAIFSDGLFPIIFRQDPRYYRKGSGKIVDRILYSADRILITRTDAGNTAPNYSRLFGAAGAYALTMAYYPAVSATWPETAEGYGLSLLTGALGNQLHEFAPDVIKRIRHRHRK